MDTGEPIGFTCFCGHQNRFPTYVFAHWRDRLKGKCEGCKRKVFLCAGIANPQSRRKTDPSQRTFTSIYKTSPEKGKTPKDQP